MIKFITSLANITNYFKTFTSNRFFALLHSSNMEIQTFIFMDLETTGIPWQESNKTKITEICLMAVDAKHLKPGVFPRATNKLNLCLNPRKMINIDATKITGLSNDLLEYQPMFTQETAEVIKGFLNLHRKPLCLVAHNGDKFDYPILRAELEKSNNSFPEDLLCIDSLELFKKMYEDQVLDITDTQANAVPIEFTPDYDNFLIAAVDDVDKCGRMDPQTFNETTPKKGKIEVDINPEGLQSPSKFYYQPGVSIESKPSRKKLNFGYPSFKLADIYTRFTKKEPIDTHRADGDVSMLIECASSFNTKFIKLANLHHKKLVDISVMRPGIRIGT